jgi:anti-sigma regulatory factor (Ser/Thr protein kinase)
LATSISCWVFLAVQAVYYLAGKSQWKLSFRKCVWKDAAQICLLGYPGALSRFVEMFRCFIVNALLLTYVGSAGLAAFAASNSLLAIIWAVPFGMVAVGRMVFSISRGEEDRRTLIDIMRVVLTRGMLIMACIAGALLLLAVPLTRLFFRDVNSPVYQLTLNGFRILPWCMPLAIISLTFAAYLQVMEKKWQAMALAVTDGAVGVVLFSLILIPVLKMDGLYIANVLNGVLCFALITFMSWLEKKHLPRSVEDLMIIPDSFGVPDDQRMDITVRSMEKVTEISERIQNFCLERHIDARRAYYAGLCMEEMAGNIVTHGFAKDKKKHSVDIRLTCTEGRIILRMRDDCAAFDPSQHARILNPEDGVKDYGIRMVYDLAKEVNYQNLLDQNVLTITL